MEFVFQINTYNKEEYVEQHSRALDRRMELSQLRMEENKNQYGYVSVKEEGVTESLKQSDSAIPSFFLLVVRYRGALTICET